MYLTGVLELAGAVGLLVPRLAAPAAPAALGLVLLALAVFSAALPLVAFALGAGSCGFLVLLLALVLAVLLVVLVVGLGGLGLRVEGEHGRDLPASGRGGPAMRSMARSSCARSPCKIASRAV
ncbi:hypothetical protein ACIRSF_34105 [Streptomyces rubiginosohelvolus]|uniref:hypothetical protein n=1 Tax=Streptomyces rubiginosohelvolus TaxID=67362 RepID=UPI00382B2D8E